MSASIAEFAGDFANCYRPGQGKPRCLAPSPLEIATAVLLVLIAGAIAAVATSRKR
ncbi:hypothetical protein [Lacipirellula limnantheis]|uniref:Uncharacterized protein n=1 Tax=Lacipirellula limnantheis TaxID=2528024 RepID=A0A517TRK9_9BACT|nr:hypothetical protein [Lacipirellula limnantheis]QDT71006.1 hypothetical protein I41_01610 [Lacipirellula limnantheis]